MPDTVSLVPGLRSPGTKEEGRQLLHSFAEFGELMSRLRQKEEEEPQQQKDEENPFPSLHGPWKNHNGCTHSGTPILPDRFLDGTNKNGDRLSSRR